MHETTHEVPEWMHTWKIPFKLMQISAWKVHFAVNTINHCQLMYHPSHLTTEHTINTLWKTAVVGVYHCSTIFLSASLCQLWTHNLSHPIRRWDSCWTPAGAWAPWEPGSYFAAWHKGHLFTLLCSLALRCEHSQASQRKEPLCDTHLTLKSSAASLALSISSMIRAFSSVFFLTWAGKVAEG